MSLGQEQALFLLDFCRLVQYCTTTLKWRVTAGELQRPVEMQKIYVETGRSKTMDSRHIRRLAGDLNFFDENGKYLCTVNEVVPAGIFWESLNPKNVWGGNFDRDAGKEDNFKDAPHFERKV